MNNQPRKIKKPITSLVVVCLFGLIAFGLFAPQPTHAQLSIAFNSQTPVSVAQFFKQGWEKFRDNALALAYKNLLGTFLQQMAYDAATFVASGGEGQDSLVYDKPAGEYFRDINDAALGSAVEGFAQGLGFSQGLCRPPDVSIDIAYGLMTQFGSSPPPGPACTLSQMAGNWSEAFSDPEYTTFLNLYYDPRANSLGTALATTTHVMEDVAGKEEAEKWQRLYDEGQFKSVTESVSGWIQTPSTMIKTQMEIPLQAEEQKWGQYTGSILADTAGVFLNTLTSKLFKRLKEGMFNTVSGSSLASLMAGSTGGTVAGVTAAEEVYASLNKPSFIASGVYNVMNEFITCPPDPAQRSINNCVIGSAMQSAIDSKWTTQEFIDYLNTNGVSYKFAQDDLSSPEEGLSMRALVILKKFRVLPVGWQIAGEYINGEIRLEEQSEYSLQDVADRFDDCGPGVDEYSPLCKLVDPYWVLKAPENYCAKEAPNSDIIYESFDDLDGNPNTQDEISLSRNTACVDERACIEENNDGTCSVYGYCTEEKRTYNFQGEYCDEQYSSCQSFVNEDGDVVSYLKNTVNQDDCATNPGCKWYCQYADNQGTFMCLNQTEAYIACSEENAGIINGTYVKEESCTCEDTITCEVPNLNDCGNDPDCPRQCTAGANNMTCELDDNCGADYPTYNPATQTCTCTLNDSCQVGMGSSTCGLDWGDSCSIGDSCTETSTTYVAFEYCTCTDQNSGEECNVDEGNFECDLATAGRCNLGALTEDPDVPDPDAPGFYYDISINFDNDLEECDEDDATCNLYYRNIAGNNLVPNSSFNYIEGNGIDDSNADFFGACSENGNGCNDNTACIGECQGWQNQAGGLAVSSAYNSDVQPQYNDRAILLPSTSSGSLTNIFDTGKSLDNRTFTVAFRVMALDDCEFNYSLSDSDDNYTDANTQSLNAAPGTWIEFDQTVNFPESGLNNKLKITIDKTGQCASSEIAIDAVYLEEGDSLTDFTDYGEGGASYLKQDELLECSMDDVGCELYTPVNGNEDDSLPTLITNPNSNVCLDPNFLRYQNPDCSQCPSSQVGCNFYQEKALTNLTPLTDPNIAVSAERSGVIQRTGYYCENDMSQSCYDSNDCGGDACVPDISIIPSTGQTCSASQVGCEEYTNLDEVSAGGEGLEYYSYIRQCVTPADNDAKTYYTWVGSDVAGYQLQSYLLKSADDANGSPCTILNPSQTDFDAACYNDVVPANDCQAVFGVDPDCRQYYDAQGYVYYRYESEVIYVSEECTPLRNSLDDNTYYSIPAQSTTCSEANVGCREYEGTDGGNVEYIIDADFASNTTTGWSNAESTSSESAIQGDYSLSLTSANQPITYDLTGLLEPGQAYTLSFWIMDPLGSEMVTGIEGAGSTQYFTENGSTTNLGDADISVSQDWKYYELGPIFIPDDASINDGDELFFIENTDNSGYVDNIQLKTSSSQYLIKGSSNTCAGYEGCQAYTDRAGEAHYLKSFIRLCNDQNVGCEIMTDSFNSTNPFTQMWNTENEYSQDIVRVPHDMPKSFVYNEEAACRSDAKGCTAMGLPDINEQTGVVDSFETVFRINDPDNYATLLCEQHQLQCEAFYSDFDGTLYFKNPGNKTCEWLQDSSGNFDWFKTGSDFEVCPTRDTDVYPSIPIGSVCNSNSGSRIGRYCTQDADCEPGDGSTDGNAYPPRCISDFDEDANNDLQDTTNFLYLADGFGWTGTCPENASGCTTYNDSSSPNIEELAANASFEDDVRDNSNNTFYEVTADDPSYEALRDHLPDFWEDPFLACTDDQFTDNTDEFFEGSKSVQLNQCSIYSSNKIPVYSDKLYNLSGYFKGDSGDLDLGLEYYDDAGNIIQIGDSYVPVGQNYLTNGNFEQGDASWTFPGGPTSLCQGHTIDWPQNGTTSAWIVSLYQGTSCYNSSAQFEVPVTDTYQVSAYFYSWQIDREARIRVTCTNDNDSDPNCADRLETIPANQWTQVTFDVGVSGANDVDYNSSLSYINGMQVNLGTGVNPGPGAIFYGLFMDGVEVRTNSTFSSYPNAIAAQQASVSSGDDWTYYYAHIGPGSIYEFPDGTAAVKIFVAENSDGTLYADNVSLKEVDQYHYLDYTVDGTTEYAQITGSSTCANIDEDPAAINSGGGCVGFQDTLNYSENIHPLLQGQCTVCTDGINDSDCYNNPNACNANSIIKVQPDRVCDEWVACRTARVVENDDGTSDYTCFSLDQCTGMDEQGRCNEWEQKPAYSEISDETDLTYISSADNNTEVDFIQNLTGYVKAGLTWPNLLMCNGGEYDGDVCESNTDCEDIGECQYVGDVGISNSPTQPALFGWRCVGGSLNGQTCQNSGDCVGSNDGVCSAALQIDGFYPFGWMPEVGLDGVDSAGPIIENGDFENLYCDGADANKDLPCILDKTDIDELQAWGLDANKGQCWLNEFEGWADTHDGKEPTYVCPNSPTNPGTYGPGVWNWPFDGWTGYTGSENIAVRQYENKYDPPDNLLIDINNVLQVEPDEGDFASGVKYDLSNKIIQDGQYALSFKGRYTNAPINTDTIDISFEHANGDHDYFLKGNGMVDVIFVVDRFDSAHSPNASVSMNIAIDRLGASVTQFNDQIEASAVDAKYGIVVVGGSDLGTGLNNLATCPNPIDDNYMGYEMTSDVGAIQNRLYDITSQNSQNVCTSTPEALIQTLSNTLESPGGYHLPSGFEFRDRAKKYIVLLSNAAPVSDNDVQTAIDVLLGAQTPLYAITLNEDVANNQPRLDVNQSIYYESANPFDFYDSMTNQSGGKTFSSLGDADYHTGASGPLYEIANLILEQTEKFQFSTNLETYTFGPITVEAKGSDPTQETDLVFQAGGLTGFQIDDVSLLPTLEINKRLDTIARSCRAYPAEDAPACTYTQPNAQNFRGWKGYCLELDPENSERCITWWPLDMIAGESSLFQKDPAGYSGRSSVYYCMVSKGYGDVGFCSDPDFTTGQQAGTDAMCSTDGECDSGNCYRGAWYYYPDFWGDNAYDLMAEELPVGGHCGYTYEDAEQNDVYPCQEYPSGKEDTENEDQMLDINIFDIDDNGDCTKGGFCTVPSAGDPTGHCVYQVGADLFDGAPVTNETLPMIDGIGNQYDYTFSNVVLFTSNKLCTTTAECTIPATCTDPPAIANCSAFTCNTIESKACAYDSQCDVVGQAIDNSGNYQVTTRTFWQPPLNQYATGVITKSSANAIEKNINISEVDKIEFFTGSAAAGLNPTYVEKKFWAQDADLAALGTFQKTYLNDLAAGKMEVDEDTGTGPWTHCQMLNSGTKRGEGCYWYGNVLNEGIDMDIGDNGSNEQKKYDLLYVYAYSNFKWKDQDGSSECTRYVDDTEDPGRSWKTMETNNANPIENFLSTGCVEDQLRQIMQYGQYSESGNQNYQNPFQYVNSDIKADVNNDNTGNYRRPFAYPAQTESGYWSVAQEYIDVAAEGVNVFATYLDYDDKGYLQDVYTLTFAGANMTGDGEGLNTGVGINMTYDQPMYLKYYLREPCAVVGEAVTEAGDNQAWAYRASNAGLYLDTELDIDYNTTMHPFASIKPYENNAPPSEWDTYPVNDEDNSGNLTTYGPVAALTFQGDDDEFFVGRPYSCIGECGPQVCGGPAGTYEEGCSNCSDDGQYCIGVGSGYNGSNQGLASDQTNIYDQIQRSSVYGSGRLQYVMANMVADRFYIYDPPANNSDSAAYLKLSSDNNLPDDLWLDGYPNGTDRFENMGLCGGSGATRPTGQPAEYCGVKPVIDDIKIDGRSYAWPAYEIDSGQMVELTFNSEVDQEQLPLKYIEISWGDGNTTVDEWDSAAGDHNYNHAYSCTPELDVDSDNIDDNYCKFQINMTIVDNWLWCSGSDQTENASADYRLNGNPAGPDIDHMSEDCGSGNYTPFAIGVPE